MFSLRRCENYKNCSETTGAGERADPCLWFLPGDKDTDGIQAPLPVTGHLRPHDAADTAVCLSRVFSQELGSLGELLLMYLSYSVRKSHLFTQQICLECWVHILEAEDTATNKIHRTVHDSHAPIEGAEPPARGCHIKPSTGCHAEGSHKHTHQMNSGGWNNSKVNPARHTSSTLS